MTLSDLQRFMTLVQQQIEGGESWTKAEGRHVILNYVAADPAYSAAHVREFQEMYDKCVEDDCAALSLDPPDPKIPVFLFPKTEDLQHALHVPLQGGISMGYWTALPDDAKGVSAETRSTAAHELGHALVHRQIGLYGCGLFNEGIAYYLQDKEAADPRLSHPRPLVAKSLRSLCESAVTVDEYQQGAFFIAFLMNMDKQDPTRIKRVLKAMSTQRLADLRQPGAQPWPHRVENAFKEVYGETMDELEHRWHLAG